MSNKEAQHEVIFTAMAVNFGNNRMTPNIIGKIVLFHRKKAALSQQQLADLAGVGKTVIFDIEKGKMTIRYETLLKVLSVLNITIEFQSPFMSAFKEVCHEKS